MVTGPFPPKDTPPSVRAYVAMRGASFQGMIIGSAEPECIRQFYADFSGCDVRPVYSNEEYLACLPPTETPVACGEPERVPSEVIIRRQRDSWYDNDGRDDEIKRLKAALKVASDMIPNRSDDEL
jgi:hypothetical protein